jgi:hypothetical protein
MMLTAYRSLSTSSFYFVLTVSNKEQQECK